VRLLSIIVLAAACSEDPVAQQTPRREQPIAPRRELEPPSTTARLLPPYVITATEVGPYKLRQRIATLLDQLPKGPRMERFEIPNVIHTSLMRAEEGTVLIGGEPSASTTFVAVINSSEVAGTEQGVHVGAKRAQLEKLGPLVDEPDRAFAKSLVVPAGMRNARFVIVDDRVIAIVILSDPPPSTAPIDGAPCVRPKPPAPMFGACTGGGGKHVAVDGEEILIYTPDVEKPISIPIANLQFAVALRNPLDGRDEVVAVARTEDGRARTWTLSAYRLDGAKPVRVIAGEPIYTLTSSQARWIGAELHDIDLHLELTSKADGIEVGGLLTTQGLNGKIRDVIAISPVTAQRRHHAKPATGEPTDAGVPEPEPESDAKTKSPEP
jgi:hypothetical protein